MNTGPTIFAQLMAFIPTYQFQLCVDRYQGHRYVKDSLAGIHSCVWLSRNSPSAPASATSKLVCALNNRSSTIWACEVEFRAPRSPTPTRFATGRIYRDFAQGLIATARDLYHHDSFGVELSQTVYAFDSTTIDLCLSLFPWGKFRRHKSAVKLHTLLDLRGSIPTSVYVTGGQVHDVNLLDELLLQPGAFYLLDRGYVDFARLYAFTQACAFFITRAKKNMQFSRRGSRPVEPSTGVRCDQTIVLTGIRTAQRYPAPLRRVRYFDAEKDLRLTFLTNNFLLSALTVAQLYRARWQVELFFRWIKQYLHIQAFYGTSENAVKTQVWIALAVYALVAIVKKQLRLELSLYQILQILSITIFEKSPISEGFLNMADETDNLNPTKQLNLFEF